MKDATITLIMFLSVPLWAASRNELRLQAEYYVSAYSRHYDLPVEFVRALIEQESGWKACVVSRKGAVGLMQLMPATAQELHVRNRCDLRQNIAGGIRYLGYLRGKFGGDLRLVAAAYYAGERPIERRGLTYSNIAVVAYVESIRRRLERGSFGRKGVLPR